MFGFRGIFTMLKFLKRLLAVQIIITIVYQPVLFSATIVIDPRSGTVTLDKAQNGVPLVNIAAKMAKACLIISS